MFRLSSVLLLFVCLPLATASDRVNITERIPYIDIMHKGEKVRIARNPDTDNTIEYQFSLTSRPCPPYCIQPMQLGEGVETIGELELLEYLQKISKGNESILLIDSREAKWISSGMIPGAIHLPWNRLHNKTATDKDILELLLFRFDVIKRGKLLDFQHAKTLILYCNGSWCGQSPSNIRSLTVLGYPPGKIKWYRGGMQAWKSFGLTTVKP